MMEKIRRTFEPEVLVEEYERLLQSGEAEALPLVISGNSMSPFLVHGRDTVFLSKPKGPFKKGDMLLYRRRNGAYILHRVYKAEKDGLTMIGDAQTEPERGIAPEQVIAKVTAVERKGKILSPGSFWWDFFEKVWINAVPLRNPVRNGYNAVKKLILH